MLDRAQRLQRQFFTPTTSWPGSRRSTSFEVDDTLQVHVALPGVSAGRDHGRARSRRHHHLRVARLPLPQRGGQIHRLEIPYGRFERHIGLPLGDPYTPLELVGKLLADGVLTLTFRRKEGT